MADPFEVRVRFSSQLQNLNASVTSARKAAAYALKYKDMDEDLHSCILEQLEKTALNTRANIMYFIEHFLELAQREGHNEYVAMIQRDIIRVVDAVAPESGQGAANVKVVRRVLQGLQQRGFLDGQVVTEIEEVLREREADLLRSPGVADEDDMVDGGHGNGSGSGGGGGSGVNEEDVLMDVDNGRMAPSQTMIPLAGRNGRGGRVTVGGIAAGDDAGRGGGGGSGSSNAAGGFGGGSSGGGGGGGHNHNNHNNHNHNHSHNHSHSTTTNSAHTADPPRRLDKKQIEERIEEDRERHKRLRENIWAVPGGTDAEMWKIWEETSDLGEDDHLMGQEEQAERSRNLLTSCTHREPVTAANGRR